MAVTNYQLPTIATETVFGAGTYTWSFKERLYADDASSAYPSLYTGAIHNINELLLVHNNAAIGTDQAADPVVTGANAFGGSANLMGATLTPAIVNDPTFGVRILFGHTDNANKANYLWVTGFDFDLPSNATVNGVEVIVQANSVAAGGGVARLDVDTVQVRVTYTWPIEIESEGDSVDTLYIDDPNLKPKDKTFRYFAFDYLRNYIGELLTVQGTPDIKQDMNNLHSSMTLTLAQNEQTTESTVAELLTEDDEGLLTEDDEQIVLDITAPTGLGEGTDVDTNNEIDAYAYHGQYVYLTTEDDEPLLTEDGDFIMVEDGAPAGELIFTGYISKWKLPLSDNANLQVTVLSHSQELNNIMLETDDTAIITNVTAETSYIGIAGAGPGDNDVLAQTFTMPSTQPIRRLVLQASGWGNVVVTATLQQGTPLVPVGSVLATANKIITAPIANNQWQDLNFDFGESITLTNGVMYFITLTVNQSKTGGNPTYPANFRTNTAYGSGTLYMASKNSAFADQSRDLMFTLYKPGGATTRNFNSTDPGTVLKNIIDFARTRGARVTYTNSTIETTGTTPSIEFKSNTIAAAIAAVLKAAPADWYYYYDPAYNELHFHPRPTTPTRYVTKGRNVVGGEIEKSIEQLVNDLYFTGGVPAGSPTGTPNKFIRLTDVTHPRKGLKQLSDTHFTDEASMVIVGQSEIDRGKDPIHAGSIEFLQHPADDNGPADEPLEEVQPGILLGFIGWGELIDALELQLVSRNYKGDTVSGALSYQPPKISKRVEDIKRELAQQEQNDNPTSPTVY